MPELLDLEWFSKRTKDPDSLQKINEALLMQKVALIENIMPIDEDIWELILDGRKIYIEKSSAVNALEIYQEIFRDADHIKVAGFTPHDGQTVVDLGANLGFYGLFAKGMAPLCKYYGVEPNPYIFSLLKRNLACYNDAYVLQAAAGKIDERADFELIRQLPSIGGATLRQVKRNWLDISIIEKVQVEFMTIESICNYFDLKNIDLLKIDIEGYEGELIDSTPFKTLQKASRVVLETHTIPIQSQIIERFEEAGFTLILKDNSSKNINYGNLYFQNNNL